MRAKWTPAGRSRGKRTRRRFAVWDEGNLQCLYAGGAIFRQDAPREQHPPVQGSGGLAAVSQRVNMSFLRHGQIYQSDGRQVEEVDCQAHMFTHVPIEGGKLDAKFWRFPRTRGDRPTRASPPVFTATVPPHARG